MFLKMGSIPLDVRADMDCEVIQQYSYVVAQVRRLFITKAQSCFPFEGIPRNKVVISMAGCHCRFFLRIIIFVCLLSPENMLLYHYLIILHGQNQKSCT